MDESRAARSHMSSLLMPSKKTGEGVKGEATIVFLGGYNAKALFITADRLLDGFRYCPAGGGG